MKIYFAVTGNNEPEYLSDAGLITLLCSFHYYKQKQDLIIDLISKGCDIFIDSGAFSAHNAGEFIDIHEYSKFLVDTKAVFYAGLDVIGSAEKTMENQRFMEKEYGLKPIPTFHMGEPLSAALALAEEYEYIAIGGMVFSEGIRKWLDNLWNQLLKTRSDLKCHGFGLTNAELIARYPWQSVDSSSFKAGKRFGRMALYNPIRNELITHDYNEWIKKYAELTADDQVLDDTAFRYKLTDTLSAKAYQKFVNHIDSNNRDFGYVTAQQTLF